MLNPDLQAEIRAIQSEIQRKEQLFDFGMHSDKEFAEMKKLYIEIKVLKSRLNSLLAKNKEIQRN